MNTLAFGLNAVEAMYDLCFLDQGSELQARTWALPHYNLVIGMTADETRYAVWGLFSTVDAGANAGYWQISAMLHWQGRAGRIGQVTITEQTLIADIVGDLCSVTPSLSAKITVDDQELIQPGASASSSATATGPSSPTSLGADRLIFSLAYNGVSLRNKAVFKSILAIMAITVQSVHVTGRFEGFTEAGGFTLVSEHDMHGEPLLEYKHVYKLMRAMARWMVANRKFQETDIAISKSGVTIATGRLSKWEG